MKNWTLKQWYTATVIAAFVSVISFFQINSFMADKNHLNGLFTALGIITGLAAAYALYKAYKISN